MLRSTVFFAALASLFSNTYAAIGPQADFHVVNKVIAPDGFSRSAVLAGGSPASASFPGPLVTGWKGNNFKLNVIDSLTDVSMLKSTSIHWHGFFMAKTAWADGPAHITQCPISPGHSFLYDFKVPDQAGTFWYHSHLSTQYCDGLRGAFVVYDLLDPHRSKYDIDNEDTVITLADWYHHPAATAGVVPTPESNLINGKGRYAGGPATPFAVIKVIKGLRYRFRLVNTACDPNYVFSIDGHGLASRLLTTIILFPHTVIEADGVNTQPLEVDSIQIYAGQRYSFVLKADQPIGNYWIRSNPNIGTRGFEGGLNLAILRYLLAPTRDPTTTQTPSVKPLLETNLHPLTKPAAPGRPVAGGADVAINLAVTFDFSTLLFMINGAIFSPPTVPVLLQIMSGAQSAQDLLPAGSVYTLPPNKVIELTIPGGTIGSPVRPLHSLHIRLSYRPSLYSTRSIFTEYAFLFCLDDINANWVYSTLSPSSEAPEAMYTTTSTL
ncbi:Acyl-coenzyme A oxidase 2 [Asterophora parasitica]|uniref:Acyl-coenzyme A oxidase 2 n=1 Tax=Asterophora parasitica TaxID=117018 RepID=A0A9P7KD51_9AGAR|nr:Acyl-coenzyme A oxidase 2 [Asterophora parasitica]